MAGLLIDLAMNMANMRRDIQQTQRHFQQFSRDTKQHFDRMGAAATTFKRLVVTAFAGWGLKRIAGELFDTALALDRLDLSLKAATGSIDIATKSKQFLRYESERLGLVFMDQVKGFQNLAASAKGTNVTMAGVKEIYLGIAEAGAALQMSSDDISGAFRALSQVLSKGKLQAEEIRGQLGERLPGAFQIAARAMKMNTAELSKALEMGEVYSEEFLPKFAAELRKTYGEAATESAQSMAANVKRLANAWLDLKKAVIDSGVGDAMVWSLSTGLKIIKGYFSGPTKGALKKSLNDVKEWRENLEKELADISKSNVKEDKKTMKSIMEAQKEKKKLLASWAKESKSFYKLDTDYQIDQLNIQYKNYQKVVEDKVALEQWFQREKESIEAAGANRTVKLYQELYKDTEDVYYARLAEEAYQKVLDAEFDKNKRILKNEEDALAIRFLHNEQFAEDLYGIMDNIVDAEAAAADERVSIYEDMADRLISVEQKIADNIGAYTGLPTGPTGGGYWESTLLPGRRFATHSDMERAVEELKRAEEERAEAEREITREIVRQEEARSRAAEEMQRSIEREIEARQRLNQSLAESLAAGSQSIADWLFNMQTGALAPVQNAGMWVTRYQELLTTAQTGEGIDEFLSFAKEYLDFEKAYGGGSNYGALYSGILGDVQALSDQFDLYGALANMGLGTTITEVQTLVETLNDLGVSSEELSAALADVDVSTYGLGTELMNTKTPFQNVVDALALMGATTKDKLVSVATMFEELAAGIGQGAVNITSGILAAYNQAQSNPTINYQAVVVEVPWTYQGVWGGWQAEYPGMPTQKSWEKPDEPYQWVVYGPPAQGGGVFTGPETGYPVTLHGNEAVVPLRAGAIPVEMNAREFARELAPLMAGAGGGDIFININVDGHEIGSVVAKQIKERHHELIDVIQTVAKG